MPRVEHAVRQVWRSALLYGCLHRYPRLPLDFDWKSDNVMTEYERRDQACLFHPKAISPGIRMTRLNLAYSLEEYEKSDRSTPVPHSHKFVHLTRMRRADLVLAV